METNEKEMIPLKYKTLPKIFYLKCHTREFYPETRTKLLVSIKESTHETSDDFLLAGTLSRQQQDNKPE